MFSEYFNYFYYEKMAQFLVRFMPLVFDKTSVGVPQWKGLTVKNLF